MFLTLMVIGLVGLAVMAIPAFAHGHGALSARGVAHGGIAHGIGHAAATPLGPRGALSQIVPADPGHGSRLRFIPSPRAVFSVLALYGAFGNVGVHALHLGQLTSAFAAIVPALAFELLLVRPLWNAVFRLHANASSPFEQLILSEAEAVVPFRNGRGVVSTVRDGRRVQFAARLRADQETAPVRVGDRLVIEDVDAAHERVTVSVPRG
ncbi:MAG TPA: hypothetical protein VH054_22820 [Polyangiaceae bacterium]|nr:hypothetical protein [Polyangiaceae bacterium]